MLISIIIIIAARCRWFMPIILAEIRMIAVQGQPGFWRPHLGKKKKTITKQDWWGGSSGRAPA
jgi:hypothetical protein